MHQHDHSAHAGVRLKGLAPLLSAFAVVIGFTAVRQYMLGAFDSMYAMNDFMAAFFILFSGFKFLKLRDFAEAYASYDLIAMRSRVYALAYPFVELALGLAYFFRFQPIPTNIITLLLMTVGAFGVAKALSKGEKIHCACLGTVFKIPMTYATLFEDLLMAAMALIMLVIN